MRSRPLTAKQQAEQDAYVREIVEAAPPLTQEQRDILLSAWRSGLRSWLDSKERAGETNEPER